MKRLAIVISVLAFAVGAVAYSPEAEARRRGFGIGAGIVAAAVIGGIIAASAHRHRAYARPYYGYTPYYAPYYTRSYAYAAPVYRYYRPVYYSRPIYYSRPVYRVRPVFVVRSFGGRRWR